MALYAFNGTWNSEKNDVEATADNEYRSNTNVLKFRDVGVDRSLTGFKV